MEHSTHGTEGERVAATARRPGMVAAELMGGHAHETAAGKKVYIWKRGAKYLARGRLNGRYFGETLGADPATATRSLRRLLGELDDGAYVPPSEGRSRLVSARKPGRLTLRQVASAFVQDKRAARGEQTARDYAARLAPALAFAERPEALRRWTTTTDIDRDFALGLKKYLYAATTTRNGRPGGTPTSLSETQIRLVLETVRAALAWAAAPGVGRLPAGWPNPFASGVIPPKQRADPHGDPKLPLEHRVRLVARMDRWQLCHLAWSVVLPLRPDEAAGVLIADVNRDRRWLEFGHRLADCNFTKAGTRFVLPYPPEFDPLLAACIGGRDEGPLLRSRTAFGSAACPDAGSLAELEAAYHRELADAPAGKVQAAHDRKLLFRRMLRTRYGGVAEDRMAAEFKRLVAEAELPGRPTLYALRHAATQGLKDAGLPHLELRYLTGHAGGDILNVYTKLDVTGAMERYFASIRPLLDAIKDRAEALGLTR